MNDYGYASGCTSRAEYCPFCGKEIYCCRGDGACECKCGRIFYVVEDDDSKGSEDEAWGE